MSLKLEKILTLFLLLVVCFFYTESKARDGIFSSYELRNSYFYVREKGELRELMVLREQLISLPNETIAIPSLTGMYSVLQGSLLERHTTLPYKFYINPYNPTFNHLAYLSDEDYFKGGWELINDVLWFGDIDGNGVEDVIIPSQYRGESAYVIFYEQTQYGLFYPKVQQEIQAGSYPFSFTKDKVYLPEVSDGQSRLKVYDPKSKSNYFVELTDEGLGKSHLDLSDPTSSFSQIFGAINGNFRVNEMGAATYSVPINLPAGVAEVKPDLTLDYNSQTGKTILGTGWQLSGVSGISRCGKTLAQDNVPTINIPVRYTDEDALCLDGSRLRLVSGSHMQINAIYRKDIDDFSRIKILNATEHSPLVFLRETKAGESIVYGGEAAYERSVDGVVASWPIWKVEDVIGNQILYSYLEVDEEARVLDSISYGGQEQESHFNSIKFHYSKIRGVNSWVKGQKTVRDNRLLRRVEVLSRGLALREYHPLYAFDTKSQNYYMTALKECVWDESISNMACLSPTLFSWGGGRDWCGC